jgi:hypothetical protein
MAFTSGIILQNLYKQTVQINDTDYNGKYFQIIDLKESYDRGLHYFALRGSLLLQPGSEIYGELLDQQGQIIKLYLVNEPYSQIRGVPTLGFEITSSTIPGDAVLCLIGTTRDNKLVRWFRTITIVNEDTQNDDEFGGFVDLPGSIPVEVSGSYAIVDSGSSTDPLSQSWNINGTGSYFNAKLRWLNHHTYGSSYIATQSQGSASNYFQSYPTTSKLNNLQLKNIDKYHVFAFSTVMDGTTWSSPPLFPDYYPSSSTTGGSTKGTWYWIGSVNTPQGTASGASTYIEYVIPNVPMGKPIYMAVYMTTNYTLDRWTNNVWEKLPKGGIRD